MASTFTIPLTTITVGAHHFPPSGGASVPDADQAIILTIDRTVTGGLNSLTPATVILIQTAQSGDGGTTWQPLAGCDWPGGLEPDKRGGNLATDDLFTQLNPGTGRLVRADVTVTGPSSVAVAGSITTQ